MEQDQWVAVREPAGVWVIAYPQQVPATRITPAALPVQWDWGAACGALPLAGGLVAAVVEDE